MKEFWKKNKDLIIEGLVILLIGLIMMNMAVGSCEKQDTINLQRDSLVRYQVEHRVLKTRIDTLTARNAKLNIELILNDCNQYKIHEKINSIPRDSLLLYADSLLSEPIIRETGTQKNNKNGGFGRTIKKLLGIQRPVSGPKGESCGGDCG